MAEWDSQSDSFISLDACDFLDAEASADSITSNSPSSKTLKRRSGARSSQTDILRKTPTGLPHYPQAPPSVGTGPTGDPLFTTDSPSTAHVHTDFPRDFDDLFDDDDFD